MKEQSVLESVGVFIGGAIGTFVGTAIESVVYSLPIWFIFTILLGFGISFKVFFGWIAAFVLAVRCIVLAIDLTDPRQKK